MLPQEIIRKKRDGHSLSDSEIQYYIEGIANGSVSESHIAAFCMAVIFKGMSVEETFSLIRLVSCWRLLWHPVEFIIP